jgi:diguanylate cyclase (GGDEF)-like protein/PAS domain S-box-containing protein
MALWRIYLLTGSLLTGVYLCVPPFAGSHLVFNILGLSPVIAIGVGLRLHRPVSRGPWLCFLAGFLLFWLGDLYTYNWTRLTGEAVPFPSLGDGAYLLVYPVLMAGLVQLVRRRNLARDRAGVIDSVIITLGLALLSWVGLIAPYIHDGTLGLSAKATSVAYPLGDVLLLAVAIRLAVDAGRRQVAFYLLAASILALLVTDFAYGLAILHDSYHHQLVYDVGWIGFYVLWGAAALHPSMRGLEQPQPDREPRLTSLRLLLLMCACLVAPAIELWRELSHPDIDLVVVIGVSGVLFAFVIGRMAGLIRVQERSVVRERALSAERAELAEEVQRRAGDARLGSLVRNSSDMIGVLDEQGTLTYQSASIEQTLGFTSAEVVGSRFERLIADPRWARLLSAGADATDVIEFDIAHRDGSSRALELHLTNLLHDEHVGGVVVNARDVSERRAFERQLEHQAFHDPVTGLANRALFGERVRHAATIARREQRGMAVIFLDLDEFKVVNDSLGHAAGDAVLVAVAKRLEAASRSADTPARFGGDEFAVLLEDIETAQEAADVAERILAALREPLEIEHKVLVAGASLGISVCEPGDVADAEALVRNADAAMYIAKRDGRGGYRLFEPAMHEGVLARLELKADLQHAIAHDEFELHYQPIVSLRDGTIRGVEALLRWRHPTRGMVGPDQFIPLTEETGMIVELGRWVLGEGCRQACAIQSAVPADPPLTMSVNLSVKQLQHPDIVEHVRAALVDSGLDPARLVLEITESVVISDADRMVERLTELKALGVRLAMDDFGTGYSSLSYLTRLPVDILKMDRSFLRPGASSQASSLASAVVGLGATLSLQVVAEGIEHAEQWERLRDLGCELGQGFLFARPMVLADTLEYLRRVGAPAALA